jgi:hypothetical protein
MDQNQDPDPGRHCGVSPTQTQQETVDGVQPTKTKNKNKKQ